MKRSRLKFGMIAFFALLAVAVLKHWLPGISETIVVSACVPVLGYILSEGFRPSPRAIYPFRRETPGE